MKYLSIALRPTIFATELDSQSDGIKVTLNVSLCKCWRRLTGLLSFGSPWLHCLCTLLDGQEIPVRIAWWYGHENFMTSNFKHSPVKHTGLLRYLKKIHFQIFFIISISRCKKIIWIRSVIRNHCNWPVWSEHTAAIVLYSLVDCIVGPFRNACWLGLSAGAGKASASALPTRRPNSDLLQQPSKCLCKCLPSKHRVTDPN